MTLRSIRRPFGLFFLPWLLVLLEAFAAVHAADVGDDGPTRPRLFEPEPLNGCMLDPQGCT